VSRALTPQVLAPACPIPDMDTERLESMLLEHMPAAVVVSDGRGSVLYANRAARTLYDCEPDALLPPELALAVRSAEPWEGDITYGRRRVHCRAMPVYDPGRRLVGAITVSFEQRRNVRAGAELRDVGARIASARAAAGLTQHELAERLGVTRRSVQGYEAGHVAPYRHLDRLAEVLDRSRSWFLLEDDDLRIRFASVSERARPETGDACAESQPSSPSSSRR
jgi:transcriptional regulator with XRE-family HTH domain